MTHLHSIFRKNNIILFLFWITLLPVTAQIPVGSWRTHPAYLSARYLALTENSVFCATTNGFFELSIVDFNIQKFSNDEGFYGKTISQIAYDKTSQTLVLTYQDGIIELFRNKKITKINTLQKSGINSEKNTRNITFYNQNAYLALPFGVLVINLQRQEIRETYQNLGQNGSSISVWQVAFANDTIFAATNKGVLKAPLNSNLKDFNNWIILGNAQNLPQDTCTGIISFEQKIYALFPKTGILYYDFQSTNWKLLPDSKPELPQSLQALNAQIALCAKNAVWLWDKQNSRQVLQDALIVSPQNIRQDDKNNLWIADKNNGLLTLKENRWQSFTPNSPAQPEAWKIYHYNQKILAVAGGYQNLTTPLNRKGEVYLFQQNQWQNQLSEATDIIDIIFVPTENLLYFASFQNGIFSRKENETTWVKSDAPLNTQSNGKTSVTALATDTKGNIWATNPNNKGQAVLLKKDRNNTWKTFNAFNTASLSPVEILIDNTRNYLWIRLEPETAGGIWVFDETQNNNRLLNSAFQNGALPSDKILCFAQDKEGQIWIGTDKGVAVFTNPTRAFSSDFTAITPIYEGRALLRADKVQAIAIDGGNQKWIGTNNGAWLFNATGTELLQYFNADNSPLPADDIRSITIDQTSGEVFFATTAGIVSYRGKATEAGTVHQEVQIFPNPITTDFQGVITISGLVSAAQVKITDMAGKLVFQTQAQGGTATWDLSNSFQPLETGVYLVFSANIDGSETFAGKFVILE